MHIKRGPLITSSTQWAEETHMWTRVVVQHRRGKREDRLGHSSHLYQNIRPPSTSPVTVYLCKDHIVIYIKSLT